MYEHHFSHCALTRYPHRNHQILYLSRLTQQRLRTTILFRCDLSFPPQARHWLDLSLIGGWYERITGIRFCISQWCCMRSDKMSMILSFSFVFSKYPRFSFRCIHSSTYTCCNYSSYPWCRNVDIPVTSVLPYVPSVLDNGVFSFFLVWVIGTVTR
jgi:hypothetical protein